MAKSPAPVSKRGEECAAPVPVADHPKGQQRVARLRLEEHERRQEDHGDDQQDNGDRGAPSVAFGLGEAVDQADQAERGEDGSGHVVPGRALGPALVHDEDGPDGGEDGDRAR